MDLETRATSGIDFDDMRSAKDFLGFDWKCAIHTIGDHVPLALQMTSTEASTSFNDFEALRHVCHSRPLHSCT